MIGSMSSHFKTSRATTLRSVGYRWDFGDGKRGTGSTTSHKYTVPGIYKATLLVKDNDGQTALAPALVRITAPPAKR